VGKMPGDADRASRSAQEGTAVSSGESSAAMPQPALDSDALTSLGTNLSDLTLAEASPPIPAKPASASPTARRDSSNDATIVPGQKPRDPSSGTPSPIYAAIGATILELGTVLGGRYEIQKLLGMGGMGAVYKAHDLEVDRTLGLKVIRPDLAGNPAILARFKQELVLARQVTHRNIIRIYDLNEADGVKFITMEFVEGEDLRTILTREGKVSPKEAINIMRQSCSGLHAAHAEGVIHRDLKPSNIMRDSSGRVVIMDFGLAKTVQSDGMTQTGMMIGTMEYMSPEQAMGSELDARSDLFTMGLIFYELLTGNIPFRADSAIASLVKRTQERAVPLSGVDPTIPPALSLIAAKCLERDPKARYNTVQELIDDLDIFEGRRPRGSSSTGSAILGASVFATPAIGAGAISSPATTPIQEKRFPLKWVAVGVAGLALAAGVGLAVKSKIGGGSGGAQSTQAAALSLAIVPFYNSNNDPSLNWLASSLSETLSTDIGQSQRVRLVSPSRLQQVLRDLHISPQSQLDLSTLKRIADFTNADTVVYGQYAKFGDQIRINATVYDLKKDRNFELKTEVPSEKDLLEGLDNLATQVRANLSTDPDVLKDLKGSGQYVLTKSVPALRAYDEGLQLSRSGKEQDASKQFEEAVGEDPNFAMAYSRLAQSYHSLGFDDKADIASRRAVTLSDNLPTQQKYLVEANHAVIMNDTAKAIAAYEKLTNVNPDDADSQLALAGLYQQVSNYDEARKRLARVRSTDSKNVDALLASGRVEIDAGNPQAGLEFLNSAYSLATQFGNEEAKASVEQQMGAAYLDLNKLDEALKNFSGALAIRKQLGLEKGVASSLNMIATVQNKMGNSSEALANYKESLAGFQKIGDKRSTAVILMNLGSYYSDHAQYEEALKSTNDALTLYRDLGDEASQATCLNNLGTIRSYTDNFQDALTYYQQAYQIREKLKLTDDMAQSLHNLAETNVELGQYETAVNQYLKAIEIRRNSGDQVGVAINSSSLGELFTEQGKYGSALSALQESVKDFQQANDRTWLMVEATGRYGNALSEVGRWDEGEKSLEDAVRLAAEVKNDNVLAHAVNYLGDSHFYRGDYGTARQQYDKALQIATKAKNRELMAISHFNLAKLDVVQGRSAAALPVLKKLVEESDSLGLKALSVQSSIYLAQALLAAKKPDDAQQELDRAMNRAEKLGLLVEQARAHYLLGEVLSVGGKTKEYVPQYREAVRILESISKENGVGRLLDRSDLKDIYRDAMKSYQGAA
jgi:serine/threonine protein kinase/tetratricopeptide (TPR) repeat protein